jgi:segregation and condensation protein B
VRESAKAGAIEALLFVSAAPLTVNQVTDALDGEVAPSEVKELLENLIESYGNRSGGLKIERVAEGYRMVTREDFYPYVKTFLNYQNQRRLSKAAVETLAIVAYKQPATNAEVSAIRGTESGPVLRGLLEKKLLRIAGRKNIVGRPLLYATSRDFLVQFGLNSLDDLPSFQELEETFGDGVRQESLFKSAAPAEEALTQREDGNVDEES